MAQSYDGADQVEDYRIQQLIEVPEHIPSRRRLLGLVAAAQLAASASAALYTGLLFRGADQPLRELPILPMLGLAALMFLGMMAQAWRHTAALGRVERRLAEGADPRELDRDDVRDVLIHHRPLSRDVLLVWGTGTLGFAAGAAVFGAWSTDLLLHLAVLGPTFALLTAVVVRYLTLAFHGLGVTGVLLPDGVLDHLAPLPLERVYRHVIVLYGTLGVLMPLCLVFIATSAHSSAPLLVLVVLDFLVCGFFVAYAMMRSTAMPVGYLESRMAEVGDGDLNVKARIFAADTFGSLSTHFNRMVEGLRQREQIRDIFGRYVTRQVAEEILSGRVQLGGERRTATVLFADIRGFTTLSEQLDPEEVVALLNEVLGTMVRCVLDEGGVLDKFIGDAIMALFGVPLSSGDPKEDAEAAVRCAMEMSAALDNLNAQRRQLGRPAVELGIGIHTGELVAGNIGIPERMEYTVIGDTVNLCSRLEGLTKQLHHRILISRATCELLPHWKFDEVDTVHVRGRKEPVTVFTPAA
ncbi:MAG: HAMP domain-containing protein [Alphaproteobacteria bacterium]|nr:HAMP domain-containing protein [Alphaproteobacteria bacterium]MCB9796830.1 HAMP domain-containing protein [Alphaproteobacteria bacterium]